ncbi:MAG: hypothetical protein K2N51_06785 [Lachnospiraceae bacterium]|nr:hypothetical protein [Lachnospiraceae bacterium]
MCKRKKVAVFVMALSSILGFLTETRLYANGNINGNEDAVLEVLEREFTYNGEVYVIDSSYKEALRAYFAEDSVDLTADQKNKCISGITGNIGQAVSEGYMVKIRTTPKNNNKKTTQENKHTDDYSASSKEKSSKKKNNKTESKTSSKTAGQEELTEAEKVRLMEKWEKEIKDIEQKAREIRNGESNPIITNNQEKKNSNNIENKIQKLKQNFTYKLEHETGWIFIFSFGLAIVTVFFYVMIRLWRKRPVLTEGNYTDIHAHILPGVDDGAKDMETTKAMLHLAKKQGIHTIIATPHYRAGQYKLTAGQLEDLQKQVQREADKEGMDIKILLGNELYYSKDICSRLEDKKALTLAGTRYVLVEFSPDQSYTEIYQGMRELIQEGYVPILAHIERYDCLHRKKKRDKIQELIRLGVYMQMNVHSLHKRYCRKLVKDGYIHFLGSDSHNTKNRSPKMQEGLKQLGRMVTRKQMEKILIENPKCLRENKFIHSDI